VVWTGLVVLLVGVFVPVSRGGIVFHELSFHSGVNDYLGEYPYDKGDGFIDSDPQLPLQGTYTADKGECQSISEIDADWTTDGVSFSITADHIRGGDYAGEFPNIYQDYATTSFILYFTIDQPYYYSIEGEYTLLGMGTLFVSAQLNKTGQNPEGDPWIFGNGQSSEDTENEILTIGEEGGDKENSLLGSTSGILLPDNYVVIINFKTLAPSGGDVGATTTGWGKFTLTPEPTSMIMFLICGFGILRRPVSHRI
jgi:hypothetical protein